MAGFIQFQLDNAFVRGSLVSVKLHQLTSNPALEYTRKGFYLAWDKSSLHSTSFA
jgi:hypothetical protein